MHGIKLLFLLILCSASSVFCCAQDSPPGFDNNVNDGGRRLKGDAATIKIIIETAFNTSNLDIVNGRYITGHGDTITVSLFKFYITNFALNAGQNNGTAVTARNNHLFDMDDSASAQFEVAAKAGLYNSLSFNIGVDSIDNTAGALAGDLDPAKGMYWAWNTGYIMAKLEGNSSWCPTLHHAFEYHIGGYLPPYNAVRKINLPLPAPLNIQPHRQVTIRIRANLAAWFGTDVDVATTNSIVIPGKEACNMADRYARMFTITGVEQ